MKSSRSLWLLAIGYWLLAIGYWLLAVGCKQQPRSVDTILKSDPTPSEPKPILNAFADCIDGFSLFSNRIHRLGPSKLLIPKGSDPEGLQSGISYSEKGGWELSARYRKPFYYLNLEEGSISLVDLSGYITSKNHNTLHIAFPFRREEPPRFGVYRISYILPNARYENDHDRRKSIRVGRLSGYFETDRMPNYSLERDKYISPQPERTLTVLTEELEQTHRWHFDYVSSHPHIQSPLDCSTVCKPNEGEKECGNNRTRCEKKRDFATTGYDACGGRFNP